MRALRLLAVALALAAMGVVSIMLLAPGDQPTQAERVQRLAAELRCPDCQALSVAESRTAAAAAIREEIEAQVAAGRSDQQVRDHFVARYGQWILLAPADPAAWLLPIAVMLVAVAGFGAWLAAGRRRPPAGAEATRG